MEDQDSNNLEREYSDEDYRFKRIYDLISQKPEWMVIVKSRLEKKARVLFSEGLIKQAV